MTLVINSSSSGRSSLAVASDFWFQALDKLIKHLVQTFVFPTVLNLITLVVPGFFI